MYRRHPHMHSYYGLYFLAVTVDCICEQIIFSFHSLRCCEIVKYECERDILAGGSEA